MLRCDIRKAVRSNSRQCTLNLPRDFKRQVQRALGRFAADERRSALLKAVSQKHAESAWVAKLFDNGTRQVLLDFAMARNRLAHFGPRILIPIVFPSVPDENAAHARELLNEVNTLHES